jgi:AraC-like DNA-binding protein
MPTTLRTSTSCTVSNHAGCVALASVFQDPLLEEPPTRSTPVAVRRRYAQMLSTAEEACEACPLLVDCLYRAVVEHDVAGYVAGTTAAQRAQIRRRLQVCVDPEDFDTLAGVIGRHRQVDHDEVVRLRHANPHDSLEAVARRLGCSLSTVKRHLRKERSDNPAAAAVARPKPSRGEVLSMAAQVTGCAAIRQGHAA